MDGVIVPVTARTMNAAISSRVMLSSGQKLRVWGVLPATQPVVTPISNIRFVASKYAALGGTSLNSAVVPAARLIVAPVDAPPRVAVMIALSQPLSVLAVTPNVADAEPAATVTEAGTVSA